MEKSIPKNDSQWILEGEKPKIINRIILIVILLISLIIPITGTVALVISGIGFNIGILFSYVIFWGIGIFLFRILLWNSYGKEILTLNMNKINYIADYKYFKDGKQELDLTGLTIEIIHVDKPEKSVGRLRLKNNSEKIETVLIVDISKLKQIEKEIKMHYNTVHIA